MAMAMKFPLGSVSARQAWRFGLHDEADEPMARGREERGAIGASHINRSEGKHAKVTRGGGVGPSRGAHTGASQIDMAGNRKEFPREGEMRASHRPRPRSQQGPG
jgi:hypothetical protein